MYKYILYIKINNFYYGSVNVEALRYDLKKRGAKISGT